MSGIRGAAFGAALAATLALAAPAQANLASLEAACEKRDAADGETANGFTLPFWHCDDGVPSTGGRKPNETGESAIEVPAAYSGAAGLPGEDPTAADVPGADSEGNVALDVNLSLPDPGRFPLAAGEGYPLIVFMHGCCGGHKGSWEADDIQGEGDSEKWHHNNTWFAARGYAVLTYTARGFVDGNERGSTGETQLDSTRFEINDYQHLAGQLADTPLSVDGKQVAIDPQRVAPVGGSYGGGFAWLALTDPVWRSPGGKPMRVAAVVAKYGWTDLVESLVPAGIDRRDALPPTDPAARMSVLGYPKRTINNGLYLAGQGLAPPGSRHTTFPPEITEAQACLSSTDPYESNPLCTNTLSSTFREFLLDRSAYYQNSFFSALAGGSLGPVPVFSAGTFTDPLFPTPEHRRMVQRLEATVPGYPVQEYYGDYEHFSLDKRKEWSDVCGQDDHVCKLGDYPDGNLNADPPTLQRLGVNTRMNRFLDHYAKPPANAGQSKPSFDVTASLQICPQNASERFPLDQPGERFTAPSFDRLAPNTLRVEAQGTQVTTSKAAPNLHALNADPVRNQLLNGNGCIAESAPAGPGVATYESPELPRQFTMIGRTRVTVEHTGSGDARQLNARLYVVFPDGTAVLADRGVKRITSASGPTVLDLHGGGWRFPQGHRLRLELAQDDDPYIKSSTVPSSLTLSRVTLEIPVREASATIGGESESRPVEAQPSEPAEPREEGSEDEEPDREAAGTVEPDRGELPFTGLFLASLVALGALLVAGGISLGRRLRRRRAAQRPR